MDDVVSALQLCWTGRHAWSFSPISSRFCKQIYGWHRNAYDGIRKRNNTCIEIELVLFPKIICWSFGDNHPNLPAQGHEGDKGSTQWSSEGHHHLNVRHGCCQDKNSKDNDHGDLIDGNRKLDELGHNLSPKRLVISCISSGSSFSSSCASGGHCDHYLRLLRYCSWWNSEAVTNVNRGNSTVDQFEQVKGSNQVQRNTVTIGWILTLWNNSRNARCFVPKRAWRCKVRHDFMSMWTGMDSYTDISFCACHPCFHDCHATCEHCSKYFVLLLKKAEFSTCLFCKFLLASNDSLFSASFWKAITSKAIEFSSTHNSMKVLHIP